MKKFRVIFIALLITTLTLISLAGCSSDGTQAGSSGASVITDGSSAGSSGTPTETGETFNYSQGIGEDGYLEGIKALDYVEMFQYKGMTIPTDAHTVTDEDVQAQVDTILEDNQQTEVVDRPAQDGDMLNVDYVGSIDGVEFEGGSTGGAGTDITIGETEYIDDFIQQLVGHKAGDSFDINVTFPEDYGREELNGKDAVFAITINSISETVTPELTDAFVAETLAAENGWKTIAEMREGVFKELQETALLDYIYGYLTGNVAVSNIPESLLTYQEKSLVNYYEAYAAMYGVDINEFLASSGIGSLDELVETSQEDLRLNATYILVIQAIAEDAKIAATDEDLSKYFLEKMGSEDYSTYEAEYGMPHLRQTVIGEKVLDLIIDNAVLE